MMIIFLGLLYIYILIEGHSGQNKDGYHSTCPFSTSELNELESQVETHS